jgi:RNA polymerase sigma-70 factor, ECF subfamily
METIRDAGEQRWQVCTRLGVRATMALCLERDQTVRTPTGDREQNAREFEALLDPLLDSLYGAALRMTRHHDDAQDLVQDTVVKAYRFFHRFERGTNFRAWMLRVMTNLYINQYRKAERQGEQVELDALEETGIWAKQMQSPSGSSVAYDPAEQVLAKLDAAMICAAIDALPAEFRLVVTLSDVSGLSYEEIVAATGLPMGTVKSRLYRGRKQIQKQLWETTQEGMLR